MGLKYYHAEPLANSLKSMLPLFEKGLAFESVYVNLHRFEQHQPWFVALNPDGQVPVLDHDGVIITQTTAINEGFVCDGGAVRVEEGGRDAGGEVRARMVPRECPRRGEDRAGHRGRRRLAVRRRDERDALGEARGEHVDGARVELPDELPGKRRAPALSGGAREPPDEPGGGGLEREPCTHAREGSRRIPLCPTCRLSKMI